jgi:L-ascorbate metabolism protein UlaG (beta-lactamase superfamily)
MFKLKKRGGLMKIRWLGNSCVEIFEPKHIVIDPNYVIEPEKNIEMVFVTHEHDDHFDIDKFAALNAPLVAPEYMIKEFELEGTIASVGREISGVKVLESWCWGSKESVSYFYNGILHPGDSAKFPDAKDVKLAFTACFPDFYDDYILEFKRIEPELVVPFHYSEKKIENARGLKKRLDEEGINCKIVDIGETIEV